MTGEVIKSFLVGLGFGVDETSLSKFSKAITSASARVTALYASVKVAAAGIFWSISKISEGFEQMGYEYRIIAPAINKALVLRNELLKAYRAAGLNITTVVQQSIKFNMALAKTQFALKAIYSSVAAKFFPMLTKQMDIFRGKIYANMPKIQAMLEKFIKFIFKAFEATVILGNRVWSILTRVYDFFYQLHKQTDGWSTLIIGAIAAWKLLNLAFLATPLGMLISGFIALLALWDDFKTFREGGQSLINWGSDFTKTLVGLLAVMGGVAAAFVAWRSISSLITLLKGFNAVLSITDALLLIAEAPFYAIAAAIGLIISALVMADAKWKIFGGNLSGFFGGIGGKIMDFIGGSNVAANMGNLPGSQNNGTPALGGNVANQQQTNMNVNQQTQINVTGGADANAIGKNVAGQQNRVNFDMTRNLKGATR